jgi:hypothetical protein
MPRLQRKSFATPDQVRAFLKRRMDIVALDAFAASFRPDQAQAMLLDRVGLRLAERLRSPSPMRTMGRLGKRSARKT